MLTFWGASWILNQREVSATALLLAVIHRPRVIQSKGPEGLLFTLLPSPDNNGPFVSSSDPMVCPLSRFFSLSFSAPF